MVERTNRLLDIIGCRFPLISAPMAFVAGGELAQAVSNAGALGMIGGGYGDPEWLKDELGKVDAASIGIGFIGWKLAEQPEALDLAIAARPRVIMLSFGGWQSLAPRIVAAGIPLLAQVQTLADARIAVAEGAGVIVAQGTEAGGHGGARSTLALVPEVVDAVGPIPVVAAGGIGDGRGLAAALMLGAQGALCGTAFYVASESLAPETAKGMLTASCGDDTVRSNLFDLLRGYDWPSKWQIRSLNNVFVKEWSQTHDDREARLPDISRRYSAAQAYGHSSAVAVFAGESAGLTGRIRPAEQIVLAIIQGAAQCLGQDIVMEQ